MKKWLNRLAIIVPVVVVSGIYFGRIPLGEEKKNEISKALKTAELPIFKESSPRIEKVQGRVQFRMDPKSTPTEATIDEKISARSTIGTGKDGLALLSFKKNYSWKILIGPDSLVNIDELNAQGIMLNLIRGGLIAQINNPTKSNQLTVRTKLGSFSTNDGKFSVLSDGKDYISSTAQSGQLRTENFITLEEAIVTAPHTYIQNRVGIKKISYSLGVIDLYNWDITKLSALPTISKISDIVGSLGNLPDENEFARQQILKDLQEEIQFFAEKNAQLNRELEILSENATESKEGFSKEKSKIQNDIRCIENSETECVLFSSNLLRQRGFPRTWGPPRFKQSMVTELEKYLIEREQEINSRVDEANTLARLMRARNKALEEIRLHQNDFTQVEAIKTILHSKDLRH